jgi:excinuclease ABC subunit A
MTSKKTIGDRIFFANSDLFRSIEIFLSIRLMATNNTLRIQGARMHNLKNIDLSFEHGQLVVITGVSGSGKSSLAFDTLYAEGQRRYVESLSAYARQFLGKIAKPEVDDIKGLAPAIAIAQKVISRNPRSTVGTVTEINDYLRVLFARIGVTHSPISGQVVKRHRIEDVLKQLADRPKGEHAIVSSPLDFSQRTVSEVIQLLTQQGYARILDKEGNTHRLDQVGEGIADFALVIDRLPTGPLDDAWATRAADSIQTAFYEGDGSLVLSYESGENINFSNKFSIDGMDFEEPTPTFFSFNNPHGACPSCEGFGSVLGIDPTLVIPNRFLSVREEAIAAWKGERLQAWRVQLMDGAGASGLDMDMPIGNMTPDQEALLWSGNSHFKGLDAFFKHVEAKSYKIQFRVLLARYRGKTDCKVCMGSRLRQDVSYVTIQGVSMIDINDWSISRASAWFKSLTLNEQDESIARRLLIEVQNRLAVLKQVGLHYLNLNRPSSTLSGGESQRINLATNLGASLVGSMYILDEPSIGLHPRDSQKLLDVLIALRDKGNTVIVVEHDELFMRSADTLIDLGPGAGSLGGEVVYNGPGTGIEASQSLTADYLTRRKTIHRQTNLSAPTAWVQLLGAKLHNLQSVDLHIPLNRLSVICGVSGGGKTTLIKHCLVPALIKHFQSPFSNRQSSGLAGDLAQIDAMELIDQNPIGKSSRSNPATYLKVYDDIRSLYASQQGAKIMGFKSKHFSFNTDGGRCEACKGDGYVVVEMQFMADVHLSCEHCHGQRFKDEVLDIAINGKHIKDVLDMTIDDARTFFQSIGSNRIANKLQPLIDVGLGYVNMGQSSSSLSGGEAQRVKLASFLSKGQVSENILFLFDEPTTGLHFDDVQKLLKAFDALIAMGHTVCVIEHHLDVVKLSDWLIELGPEGGDAGGKIIHAGLASDILSLKDSPTGSCLRQAK